MRTSRRLFLILLCVSALWSASLPAQQFNPALFQEMRWRMIGPFRGGRTVAISGVPTQPNVFYMAPNNGGVWKSTDFGQTWTPIFDDQPTGSIGAMAVAPSDPNILYIGSGEGLRRPDLSVGDGIYKSTDGGKTWEHLGLRDAQQIGSIIVDPHDPNRVFVAVLGHPYGPNSERGVYRSTDGGRTWQKVLSKDDNVGAIHLEFDPTNPQTIYASLWASRRPPWTTGGSFDAAGSGLYKSTDGGSTWRELTKGLPTWTDGRLGRIGFDISLSDPHRMNALVDARARGGLYRSDDAGESWELVNTEERIWGRGDDFAEVRIDPRDQDKIYVANTTTYRSTDAGRNFTAIKGAPGGDDYHSIWINPLNPDIIFLGVDQGATLSANGGQTWSTWYNQPTAQFYHVITDNRFPYWVYGAQQESGSAGVASRSDGGSITFRDWHTVGVEEYGYIAPDPLDPDVLYGGRVTRFRHSTGQVQDVSPYVLRTGKYRFNRTAPLIFSPVDPHLLYFGTNVLFQTRNGGHSWEIASPDLTRDDPGVPPNLGVFAENDPASNKKHRGVIYSIAPSPKDGGLVWIGTDDGLIQVTHDGGKNWRNVTPPELTPWSKVAQMDPSHFDPQAAYAAVNRFRLDDLHPYIYRTRDGGQSWQKIVAGLPDDEPVNTVREDPIRQGLLFAGTERSIYVSFDDGGHWQSLRLNLPPSSMRDLVIHQDDVVVGTHGRSFWILDNITPLRQLTTQVAAASAHLFAPQRTYRVRWNQSTDTPLPPEIPAGQNPPDGVMLDYYLQAKAAGPVVLEIYDASGKVVRRYSSEDKPLEVNAKELHVPTYWVRPSRTLSAEAGMHRFVWDLHYPAPEALEFDYPIAAIYHKTPREPRGPMALPGQYSVKLTVGGQTFTQALTLLVDPRLKTSPEDLQRQFDLSTRIAAALHDDYTALQEIRSLRAQLKKLKPQAGKGTMADSIESLDKKAEALEGTAGGYGTPVLSGPGGSALARLNTGLTTLFTIVDSPDEAPTTQAAKMFDDLQQALSAQLAAWKQMKERDVPALNQALRKAGLPATDSRLKEEIEPGRYGTTTEEP